MANTAKPITSLTACNAPEASDVIVGSSNTTGTPASVKISVEDLLGNSTVNAISAKILVLSENTTPADSNDVPAAANTDNAIWADDDFIYINVGGSIKRAALSSF